MKTPLELEPSWSCMAADISGTMMLTSLEADSSHLYAGAACPHLHCGDGGDGGWQLSAILH